MSKVIGMISNSGKVTLYSVVASQRLELDEFIKLADKSLSVTPESLSLKVENNVYISEFLPSYDGFTTRLIASSHQGKRAYVMEKPPHLWNIRTELDTINSIMCSVYSDSRGITTPEVLCSTPNDFVIWYETVKNIPNRSLIFEPKSISGKTVPIYLPWTYAIISPEDFFISIFISAKRLTSTDQFVWVLPVPNTYNTGLICMGSARNRTITKNIKDITLADRVQYLLKLFFETPFNYDLIVSIGNACGYLDDDLRMTSKLLCNYNYERDIAFAGILLNYLSHIFSSETNTTNHLLQHEQKINECKNKLTKEIYQMGSFQLKKCIALTLGIKTNDTTEIDVYEV